jgi:hypothetical protein
MSHDFPLWLKAPRPNDGEARSGYSKKQSIIFSSRSFAKSGTSKKPLCIELVGDVVAESKKGKHVISLRPRGDWKIRVVSYAR